MKQGRLSIGVIGSTVTGIAIAQALQEAGHLVLGLSSYEPKLQEELEIKFPTAKKVTDSENLATADLVLLAVKPNEIENLVEELAVANSWRQGQLVVHLAPEYDYDVLAQAALGGAIGIAIHPAMHFTGTSLDLRRMKESYFAVNAPAVALPIAQALVIEMGAEPIVIEASQRDSYAEAIEVASNFSAMIVNQAVGLLEQAGVENPALVIAPVIESAVDQALSKGHRSIDPSELLDDQ
jgi:predicted short-subunit dehydrogenase-like oxidoreductase (DUF2520 family)